MKGNKHVKPNKTLQSPGSPPYLTYEQDAFQRCQQDLCRYWWFTQTIGCTAAEQSCSVTFLPSQPSVRIRITPRSSLVSQNKNLEKKLRPFQNDECKAKASQLDYLGIFVSWIRLEVVAQNYSFMAAIHRQQDFTIVQHSNDFQRNYFIHKT